MWAAVAAPAATQPGGNVWFLVFAGIVTAIGGGSGIAALFLVGSQRRKARAEGTKNEADGAQAISNAAVGLIKPLEERIERTESENRSLATRLRKADQRIEGQSMDIAGLRMDVRQLRGILRRIATIVAAAPAADAPALADIRELLADHAHHLAD